MVLLNYNVALEIVDIEVLGGFGNLLVLVTLVIELIIENLIFHKLHKSLLVGFCRNR